MDELFEVSFSSLADSGKPLSRCGKCRRYMKFVQEKPMRLHCKACDDTYSLPQNGSYPFCPYCYNNPPFRDMRKGAGCNSCTHPTCAHSLAVNGVCSCFDCDNGVIVLDAASTPKWKFSCNRCEVIVSAFDEAQKVKVLDDICYECGSQLVTVEYKMDKSKLPDGATEASGCLFCETKFVLLVERHQAVAMKQNRFQQRGRGRGARGRGRGGGRGRGKPKDKMARLAAYFM